MPVQLHTTRNARRWTSPPGLNRRTGLILLLAVLPWVPAATAAEAVNVRLPVNLMRAGGECSVTASPSDIGGIDQIFDGDYGTLYRSAAVNPATVQATFTQARTVTAFRAVFSHASSYRWKVESADTQQDMDAQTGSWAELVAWTAAGDQEVSTATLAAPRTARIFRLTAERMVGDDYVHLNEWELHANVELNSLAIVPSSHSLVSGQTFQYRCDGTDSGGFVHDVSRQVSWSSSNPAVAGVEAATGLCTALSVGSTGIQAGVGSLSASPSTLTVVELLAAPANLQVTPYYSTTHVRWEPVADPRVAGHHVYRRLAGEEYPAAPARRVLVRSEFTDYGLAPAQTYFYKVVAISGDGAEISEFAPEQSATLRHTAADLSTHKMLELLMVFYTGGYTQTEIDQMTRGIKLGLEFYWRTTAARLHMDVTWMYVDGYPPGSDWNSSAIIGDLRARGVLDDQYDLAYLAGRDLAGCFGGYVVFHSTLASLGTVCGVAYPGKDPGVNYTITWTFVHEIHHALEAMEDRTSSTPEVLFCHFPWCYPSPLGATGRHMDWGPHYDGIALTNRTYGDDWFTYPDPYDGLIECVDVDGDRLPDSDSRVWMDESRFGSSPEWSDADDDFLDDCGEYSARNFRGTDPDDPDTDDDGLVDGLDPEPLYAVPGRLPAMTSPPPIDGTIEAAWEPLASGYYFTKNSSDFVLTTYAGFDSDWLYLAFASGRQLRFKIDIDGSGADGRFESPVRHVDGQTDTDNAASKAYHYGDSWADGNHIYTYYGASGAQVWGRGDILGARVASSLSGGLYCTEIAIPKTLPAGAAYTWYPSGAETPVVDGLTLDPGHIIGLNVTVSNYGDSGGGEYSGTWTSLFETHSFVDFELEYSGPPPVTISAPSDDQATGGPVSYTVSYMGADDIALTEGDVTVHRTGTARALVTVLGSGNKSRTVTLQPIIGRGTLGISIVAGTASNQYGSAPAAGPSSTIEVVNVPGDFDGDRDVDVTDFYHFPACITGAGSTQPEFACLDADLDGDDDVDQTDFGLFQRCCSGPGISADPQCAG